MKAWQRERQIIDTEVPVQPEDDNEVLWEQQANGPEQVQDEAVRLRWHSQVPGSRASESICTAAVQATENQGRIVENSEALLDQGLADYEKGDIVALYHDTRMIFEACRRAKKDESSDYWKQTFYEDFESYAQAVKFPARAAVDRGEGLAARQTAGWLGQIIGGAYGTCIEGYTTDNIAKAYGTVDRYIRKPNTYNDDITYELALLCAFEKHGQATTAKHIGDEWAARIPTGWSAEDIALTNLKAGIVPPESGRFNNPFGEWIGAQMRGVTCGQLYPGDPCAAARCAWMDASISHYHNGILGEVFNAVLASLAFVQSDVRALVQQAVALIPADSEYGALVRFALAQCESHDDWLAAWRPCEKRVDHYNWIHAYPNACAEVIALWYGQGDFDRTLQICGGCGQDVDCNAAQVSTVTAIIHGEAAIRDYWKAPIGDRLDTYVRGLKTLSIRQLGSWTAALARQLDQA